MTTFKETRTNKIFKQNKEKIAPALELSDA